MRCRVRAASEAERRLRRGAWQSRGEGRAGAGCRSSPATPPCSARLPVGQAQSPLLRQLLAPGASASSAASHAATNTVAAARNQTRSALQPAPKSTESTF